MQDYNVIAERCNIQKAMDKLNKDILSIEGVTECDYDISGYLDDIRQVIIIPKYAIPVDHLHYYKDRERVLNELKKTLRRNGLKRTQDSIEDYGEHFYIVTEPCKGAGKWNPEMSKIA